METLLHGIVTVEGIFPQISQSPTPGSPVHLAILGGSFRSLVARWDLKEVPVRHRFHIREQGGIRPRRDEVSVDATGAREELRVVRSTHSQSCHFRERLPCSQGIPRVWPLEPVRCFFRNVPEVDMQDRSSPRFRTDAYG